jgi:hypothetical protein
VTEVGEQRKLLTWRNFTAVAAVYATAVAIGKLLEVELYPWANLFRGASRPYDLAIGVPFEWLQVHLRDLRLSIPTWTRDVFAIWIVLGRLVRQSIGDMAAEIEANHYKWSLERPLPTARERLSEFFKDPKKVVRVWWQKPATKESIRFTILPPGRLYVDIRGGFWSLTPKLVTVYSAYSVGALTIVVIADKLIGPIIFG